MVDNLRKVLNNLFIKVIIGIIILSFVLSNTIGYLTSNNNIHYAAKINKQKISFDQLEDALTNEYNRIQRQLNDYQYSELVSNKYFINSLRQQVLNRLIDDILIEQYIKRLRLDISNEKIKKEIFSTQAFQSDGQFDNVKYNSVIKQMQISSDQYVQILRKNLISQNLISTIIDTDFIFNDELNELIKLITQKRIVREAKIDVQALSEKQEASDVEIQNYYEQNKNIFFLPEQFRVSYIKLDAEMMHESVSDDEIQSYYDQHQKQFFKPHRSRYSLIQTKTREDAKMVLKKLKRGVDFSTIAKMKSTDTLSARKGGDIGWLEDWNIPNELKNARLRERNQISEIIRSSCGYLIARLDDFEPAEIKPLIEVRNEIESEIKYEKNLSSFYVMREKISNEVKNGKKFLSLAERISGIKAIETDWFSRENIPEDLNVQPVIDAIFKKRLSQEDNISNKRNVMSIISVDSDHAFVLYISGYKPTAAKSFIDAKDQVIAQLKHNKAVYKAKMDATKLLMDLKAGKGEGILKSVGLSFSASKILSRTRDPISQEVFSLSFPKRETPSYGLSNDIEGNVVLLALDKIIIDKISKVEKQEVARSIMHNYAQATFESIMNNLRKEAKIRIQSQTNAIN